MQQKAGFAVHGMALTTQQLHQSIPLPSHPENKITTAIVKKLKFGRFIWLK